MALEHDHILRLLLSGRVILLAYIQSIVRDSHLAEDVLQEISVLAVRKRDEIVDEMHFRAWIRRAARLESMNVLRRHHKLSTAMPEPVLEALEVHWDNRDEDWAADRIDALRQCVGRLTDNAQRLVRMRYHEGVSGIALAERLGKPVNTIYVALSRIHRVLADCVARRLAARKVTLNGFEFEMDWDTVLGGKSKENDGNAPSDEAFVELALRYLDGLTTADETERFCALLGGHCDFRELFVELCATRALMSEAVWSAPLPAPPTGEAPIDAPAVAGIPMENSEADNPALGATWYGRLWSGDLPSLPMLGIAFVSCVALATFAVDRARQAWIPSQTLEATGAGPAVASFETDYVATLTRMSNCRWDAANVSTEVGSRLPAREIHLASGVAEIVFDQGARVILEGPAYFTPQSAHAGFLRHGKLVAHVPPRDEAFTIQTPSGIVTNQGAEYGLAVENDGATDLHVFHGSVNVGMRRDLLSLPAALTYGGGHAVRIAAQNSVMPQPVPLRPDSFVRSVQPRKLDVPASLISYWNFDEQGGPAGDLVGRNDGALQGVARTKGLIGRGAIEFGDRHGQMVNVGSGDGSFTCTKGITVEAMIVSHWDGMSNLDSEGLNYDEIFRKGSNQNLILLSLQYDGNENKLAYPPGKQGHVLSFGIHVGGKYEELDMPLDGEQGRPSLAELTNGQPHHVAATYDAASGEKAIYVDGRKCYAHRYPAGSPLVTDGRRAAAIGNGADLPWEPFHGTIDEVAIYRAALSAEEIARHWARVQAGQSYFETVEPAVEPEEDRGERKSNPPVATRDAV